MGDDIVDLGVLKCTVMVLTVANVITEAKAGGGHGAVGEVVAMILKAQNKWTAPLAGYAV